MGCRWFLLSLTSLLACLTCWAPPPDLVLRNGLLIDGTGNPPVKGDLAVRDGRIVGVGVVAEKGLKEMDVAGWVVAPGFIDVHTHAENIEDHPRAENFLRMGVTTLVLGNCGSSKLKLGEFFQRLEINGTAANVASLIGHGTVRAQVMGGSFRRAPTEDELNQIRAHTAQAMRDGALGMSTGLIYLPGTFAKTEELVEMAKVVGARGGIYASHMRSEGTQIMEALDELCRIAREAHLPVHVSHIKIADKNRWGQSAAVLARLAAARKEGLSITQDQYAYTASSTGLRQLLPDDAVAGGRARFAELLTDADAKARIVQQMKDRLRQGGRDDFAYAMIAHYKHQTNYNGLSVPEAAKAHSGRATLDDQIDLLLEIEKNGGASGVFHGMHEDDLRAFLKDAHTMFASDSGVRVFAEGVPHPRGYGNNARYLARYVREERLLSVAEAVRRMTSLPAKTFGIPQRGALQVGHWADVVVFNTDKVQDAATFKAPHQYATGFRLVLVNGKPVVEDDRQNDGLHGRIIRAR